MNIYDGAHNLAKALKDCEEVKEYKNATEAVKNSDIAKKMIEDFRKLQFEAYNEQVSTGKISEDTDKKIRELAAVISINADVNKYLQAEARFAIVWEDIMKILNDAVGIDSAL